MSVKRVSLVCLLAAGLAAGWLARPGPSPNIDTEVAGVFHIFRSPAETLSRAEGRRIRSGLEIYGSDEVLRSQLAETRQGRLWALETKRLICISNTRGLGCAPKRMADQTGVLLGVFDPPNADRHDLHNFLVQGLVPDGVSHVLLRMNDRRNVVVQVESNVFSVAADNPIHLKRLLRNGASA